MQNYKNLTNSPYFQVLPAVSQQKILAQPDLSSACSELRIQLEEVELSENRVAINANLKQRLLAGKSTNAMAQLGLVGCDPFEVTPAQLERLIEVDPASFHPSSTKLTPKGLAVWEQIFKDKLGDNYKEELGLVWPPLRSK